MCKSQAHTESDEKLLNRILQNIIEYITPENYTRLRGNAEKGGIIEALILMADLLRPWFQSQSKDATAEATLNKIPNFAQAVFGGINTFKAFIFDIYGKYTVRVPNVSSKFDISIESIAKPGFSNLFDSNDKNISSRYQSQLFPINSEDDLRRRL